MEEYRVCAVQGMTEAEEDKLLALKDFMLKSNKAKASVGEQSQLGEAVHAGAIDLSALGLSGRQVDLVKARPEAEDKRGKSSASSWNSRVSAGIRKVPSPDPLPGSCSEEAHQAGLHHERGVEEHVRLPGAARRPELHGNRHHGNQASATTPPPRLIHPTVCAGERRARPRQEERRSPAGAHAAVAGHWPRLPAPHQHLQGGASAAGAAEAGAVQRRAHGQADDGERRMGEPAAAAR